MTRLLSVALLHLLAVGCGSIATLDTARIAAPGTHEVRRAVGAGQATSPILGQDVLGTGLPAAPAFDQSFRWSLGADADFAVKVLGGAPSVEARRRLLRGAPLELTTAASIQGFYLPTFGDAGGLSGVGFADLTTPLLATVALNDRHSLTASPRVGLRVTYARSDRGGAFISQDSSTLTPLLGGGLRWERTGPRGGLGVAVDVLTRPGRAAPLGWMLTLQQFAIRTRAQRRAHRAIRRSARGREER